MSKRLPFLSVQLYQSVFPPSCLCCANACCLRMPSQVNAERQSTKTYLHEAQGNNLILDPHCGPLHFVCACVLLRNVQRIAASYLYGPVNVEPRLLEKYYFKEKAFSLSTCPVLKSLCIYMFVLCVCVCV